MSRINNKRRSRIQIKSDKKIGSIGGSTSGLNSGILSDGCGIKGS